MHNSLVTQTRQRQRLAVSPAHLLGIRLLEKPLPALRAEIVAEMSANPAIEDLDHSLESPLSDAERTAERDERLEEPDYLADDFVPGLSADEAVAERRQAFFDKQVKDETLQDHLLAQLPLSDISREDWPLVEVLVGDLDGSGFYRGSLADVQMSFGKSAEEMDAIFAQIQNLDPPGCGARTVRECLLAQMDALDGNPHAVTARRLADTCLDDLGAGRMVEVRRRLGVTEDELAGALAALRTLSPRPGSDYPSEHDRVEYVNPEIHAVCRDGHWYAETDERSLPTIRISPSFEAMLKDPNQTEEVRAYVLERLARAREMQEAVAHRQQTIRSIAQEAFDRQQAFFAEGFPALKPLTETEVAKTVGVDVATVSRTVRDKYAETPFGTVELRRFFTTSVKNADGEEISQEAVKCALKEIVAEEDKSAPLSDQAISAELAKRGYTIARRTVAKYRVQLAIPGASERREK